MSKLVLPVSSKISSKREILTTKGFAVPSAPAQILHPILSHHATHHFLILLHFHQHHILCYLTPIYMLIQKLHDNHDFALKCVNVLITLKFCKLLLSLSSKIGIKIKELTTEYLRCLLP